MKTRVLLVDNNTLFRKGLASLISLMPDFQIVGDLSSGKEAAPALMSMESDLVLMDVRSPGGSGLEAVSEIKHRHPQVKIILLTNLSTEDYVRAALRLGIDGYLLKDVGVEELVLAMRSVTRGKKYLCPDVSGHVVERFRHPEKLSGKASRTDLLTIRERGVLQLIAEGQTSRSAADFLCVSYRTVQKHRASLMQKLGLRNATDMTLTAMEMGLVEKPLWIAGLMAGSNTQIGATH